MAPSGTQRPRQNQALTPRPVPLRPTAARVGGPFPPGASGVHELRSCACVRRTLPRPESPPAAPFSRRPLPLEPQGRARLPAHSVSAALTVEAGLSVPPGDQRRVGTLPWAGRPSEGLRALLSTPPFLRSAAAGCAGHRSGPAPSDLAAAFSFGCGFCRLGRGGASAPSLGALGAGEQPAAAGRPGGEEEA